MARVVVWNGTDVPREMRALPAGRYVIEMLDDAQVLTPDEEAGLEEAIASIRRGEGRNPEEVRRAIDAHLRR